MEVVSVGEKSILELWGNTNLAIPRHIKADRYRIIVPERDLEQFKRVSSESFIVQSEEDFTRPFSQYLRTSILKTSPSSYGWYLQQLIKLEALRRIGMEGERGIIWDADTVPLKRINFFPGDQASFFVGYEYHLPYFKTIDRLLGLDRIVPHSFIAQCFPCEPHWILGLCEEIERLHKVPWWQAVIDSIDFAEKSSFSEYETLGTFVANNFEGEYRWRSEPWERFGYTVFGTPQAALAKNGASKSLGISFVAFEKWNLQSRPNPTSHPASLGEKFRKLGVRARRAFSGNVSRWRVFPTTKYAHWLRLRKIFLSRRFLTVVQIGTSVGAKVDFLQAHLGRSGRYQMRIFEPRPESLVSERVLHENRDDISLFNVGCFSHTGEIDLCEITPDPPRQTSERGLNPMWAEGQVSSSRATLVQQLWKSLSENVIPEGTIVERINAIRCRKIRVLRTSEVLASVEGDVLLVVRLRGLELDVIKGLELSRLPRWVIIEELSGNLRSRPQEETRRDLNSLGYKMVKGGRISFFELRV